MDLERMLERCRKGQWSVEDFDFTGRPIAMDRFDEMEACQAFTNLIYIERIAALTFLELSKKVESPVLRAIYESFYDDEVRHAEAMSRLAVYFNAHNYKIYAPDPQLSVFVRTITETIQNINPAFASAMVTLGELVLDVALLRAVNDYIEDPLSRAVIEKVNQDESRHIAMDFYLIEEYGKQESEPPRVMDLFRLVANRNLFGAMTWAVLSLGNLFGRVVAVMDPDGKRFLEAQMRFERLGERNQTIANNRSYQVIRGLSVVMREAYPRFTALSNALKLGVVGEMARAQKRGDLTRRKRNPAASSGKSAIDLAEEMN